ncbi:Protein of unknown function [Pyronema omphalodes CBS 100304]|uniref:Uncharacterized protein n=1 Tax=Pyronema omphalodes (strain CBS 100304) TaxID=1076935 RepID=U4KZZ0_PYROM|nr:Protein of unknown function [Pyronema omphalodes CBS 100304]
MLHFLNTSGCVRQAAMVYLESDIRGMQEDIPCCDRCIARDGYIRCKS